MRALRVTRRRLASVVGAGILVLLAACHPTVDPLDPSLGAGILTPDGHDRYGLTLANGVVTAAAPTSNKGGNTRVGFWRSADQASVDQQSCATWMDPRGRFHQEGAALRVRTANGRTTAITVTNNIVYGTRWVFNVHVMDSAADPRFRQIAQFDLSEVFRPSGPGTTELAPHPWRMCARAVGRTLSFIVWPLTHAEPSWDDPRYGGSVTVPTAWGAAGYPGWHVGHLEPGDSVRFAELATAVIGPEPLASHRARTDMAAPEPTTPPRRATWIPRAP